MCIFCKIINNEIPSYKVYEDDNFLAFLDISQATIGHTLVIPKNHYSNILDMDPKSDIFRILTLVTKKLSKALGITDFNIINNCGELAGQTVHHFHFHIVPRYNNDNFSINFKSNTLTKEEFSELLLKINQ